MQFSAIVLLALVAGVFATPIAIPEAAPVAIEAREAAPEAAPEPIPSPNCNTVDGFCIFTFYTCHFLYDGHSLERVREIGERIILVESTTQAVASTLLKVNPVEEVYIQHK